MVPNTVLRCTMFLYHACFDYEILGVRTVVSLDHLAQYCPGLCAFLE